MTLPERTKGPWRVSSFDSACIEDDRGRFLFDTKFEQDTAYIVRLENAEERVVEALERIEAMPISMVNDAESIRHSVKAIKHIAHAALALLKGGTP